MGFRYACFISYRHGPQPGVQKYYELIAKELAVQVGMYVNLPVYLDTERLRGGDFFNKDLAYALCSSVCMISLYLPYYFDPEHTYTAREYQGMVGLEEKRLSLLPPVHRKGLIIPIVLRGQLPEEIRNERQYYTLDLLMPGDLKKPKSQAALRRVAEDIYHRHEEFRISGADPCGPCATFEFPSENEIMDWLTGITAPPQGMPFR